MMRVKVKYNTIELYGTPLTTAISNTHTTSALFLINAGANVNKFAVAFGNNPLLLAISKGWNHRDTDGKENSKESFDELHYAFTQKDIIQRLLKHPDLDVNAQHLGNGMSALHIACLRGDNIDLIKALMERGANLELHDYIGKKPMDYLLTPADEVKTTINRLLGLLVYDDGTAAELTRLVSTLPNTQERAKNITNIQRYFSEANSINITAKTKP